MKPVTVYRLWTLAALAIATIVLSACEKEPMPGGTTPQTGRTINQNQETGAGAKPSGPATKPALGSSGTALETIPETTSETSAETSPELSAVQGKAPQNRPPELRFVRLLPSAPNAGSALVVEASAEDPDGDPVSLSYEWYINDQPQSAEEGVASPAAATPDRLSGGFRKGDIVRVVVHPSDGVLDGMPVSRRVSIRNTAPVVQPTPVDLKLQDKVQFFRVAAEDADGDALRYALVQGPESMEVDPDTGVVRWPLPDTPGESNVVISVSDGDGGLSYVNITATVRGPGR